jgi:hypothetical protein
MVKMADIGTIRKLILGGAIIQILFIIYFFLEALLWPLIIAPRVDPNLLPLPPEVDPALFVAWLIQVLVVLDLLRGLVGLILVIPWFMWRKDPSTHKKGLIITGIIGLIIAGTLPGLLVLLGGIFTPSEL